MWIYPNSQETAREQCQSEEAMLAIDLPAKGQQPLHSQTAQPFPSVPEKPVADSKIRRGHWLPLAAFLLGTLMAGILRAQISLTENDVLTYYLNQWSSVFRIQDPQSAIILFGSEYLALGTIASILLSLGFSAVGSVLIYLVMMLYGLGNGTLLLWMCTAPHSVKTVIFFILSALPAAVSEGWLCVFACIALQASNRLRKYAFAKSSSGASVARKVPSSMLLGCYALTMFLMLPLCGISTGLSYLSSLL